MQGKIGLEEHFAIPETLGDSQVYARGGVTSSLEERLLDLQERRLAEMDEHGIAMSILSLNSPAVQAMHDVPRAIDTARRANDVLAAFI